LINKLYNEIKVGCSFESGETDILYE